MGSALGRGWARSGHSVAFGIRRRSRRDPAALDTLRTFGRVGPVAETAAAAEAVVVAVPARAVAGVLRECGDLTGRIVIDVTNPIGRGGESWLPGRSRSTAERIQALAPGARVVKAFNTIAAGAISRPTFAGQRASVFLCGDDAEAKRVVAALAESLDLDPVDAGPLANARLLETLAVLGNSLARVTHRSVDIAFKMLRRDRPAVAAAPAAEDPGADWAFVSLDRTTF